jgi:two-component system sensor histidine kinase AlgZ
VPRVDSSPDRTDSVIPNFCRAQALLPVVFVMQLVATVLTLADLDEGATIARDYILISLYLQWLGVMCAGALCVLRRVLLTMPPRGLFLACCAVLLLMTLAVSVAGFQIAQWTVQPLVIGTQERFVFSNLAIGALIAPLLLRYFWLQNQWRAQVQAEGEARYQALHARIRPHFLFNSLNSVAQLIATRPEEAERMVEDMSELFRATLGQHRRLAPLADEVELILAYLRIEQVRLGDKLKVEWQVARDVLEVLVPPLSLQPLVENAIVHGVSRCKDGGLIRIAMRRLDDALVVEIDNPVVPVTDTAPPGSRTAVRNIAQRLALIYGERATVELGAHGEMFRATLRLPIGRLPVEAAQAA